MAVGLWWSWKGCIGLGSCAVHTQVRRRMLLLKHKWNQDVSSHVLKSHPLLCSVQWLSNQLLKSKGFFCPVSFILGHIKYSEQVALENSAFGCIWFRKWVFWIVNNMFCPCSSVKLKFLFFSLERQWEVEELEKGRPAFSPGRNVILCTTPECCEQWWSCCLSSSLSQALVGWKWRSTCLPLRGLSFFNMSTVLLQYSKPTSTWALGVLHQAAILLIFMICLYR